MRTYSVAERRASRPGGVAGLAGLGVFLILHHIWITPIWFVAPAGAVMAPAGGAAMGSSYAELASRLPLSCSRRSLSMRSAGRSTGWTPPQQMQEATFETIDGAGHLPWLDDPAWNAAQLVAFLGDSG